MESGTLNAMNDNSGKARNLRLVVVRSTTRTRQKSDRFVRLSQLRKLCECEQVAAVCYRVRGTAIEFLLVRTRGSGRWTFPKGSAEPGLTHAQAAALEAFEEAGVHGRIEESPFARYYRNPIQGKNRPSRSREERVAVNAYLCEVLRLSPPQEAKRDRTWFSAEEARRRLRQGRENGDGAELARLVHKAVVRIEQFRGRIGVLNDAAQADPPLQNRPRLSATQRNAIQKDSQQKDGLQKVQFDFAEAYCEAERLLTPHIRRQPSDTRLSAASIIDVHSREVLPCEVLEFARVREKKSKALGAGTKIG
jgi:8-oxo-dGTP pyrophosphatase MutT (NUDIX family)